VYNQGVTSVTSSLSSLRSVGWCPVLPRAKTKENSLLSLTFRTFVGQLNSRSAKCMHVLTRKIWHCWYKTKITQIQTHTHKTKNPIARCCLRGRRPPFCIVTRLVVLLEHCSLHFDGNKNDKRKTFCTGRVPLPGIYCNFSSMSKGPMLLIITPRNES
jgi:hypothetical protein